MIDTTIGYELMSFLDAYLGYNQIPLHESDRAHTTFHTEKELYQYKVMPFGLKNAGATYQRLMNKMFSNQIGKTMEVYIDDMVVKSREKPNYIDDINRCFETLGKFRIRLNPLKCSFGV